MNTPVLAKRMLFGLPFWLPTFSEFQLTLITHLSKGEEMIRLYTVNPELLMLAHRNQEYHDLLAKGEWIVVDGIGVAFAFYFQGVRIPERHCGSDLIFCLASAAARISRPLLMLGGLPGRAQRGAKVLMDKIPGLIAVGYSPEFFEGMTFPGDPILEKMLKDLRPAIVAVCMGAPRQEWWIDHYKQMLIDAGVLVVSGLGGTVDFLSGDIRRAPGWVRRIGFEWLFRLIREPRRWKRQLGCLPAFIWLSIREGANCRWHRAVR